MTFFTQSRLFKKYTPSTWVCFVMGLIIIVLLSILLYKKMIPTYRQKKAEKPVSSFVYDFTKKKTITEAEDPLLSTSPYWWINSGAYLFGSSGIGQTIHGVLPDDDTWKRLYSKTNPVDTDFGYHPQNIFRALTRSTWHTFRQELYFRISADNLSASENRNESNGVLLFNRYQNENTLYYTGVRVDGTAVIKKKIDGVYHTLTQKPLYADGVAYDRFTNPNAIPKNTWIGIRSDVFDVSIDTVAIRLFVDKGDGTWDLIAEAHDDGLLYGPIISEKGLAGIRTDFMDVDFDMYSINETWSR